MTVELVKSIETEPKPKKTALLFPGQGTQFIGMGKELCELDPEAYEIFKKADKVLGYSISQICFEGPQDKLDQTLFTQPATFVYNHANYESSMRMLCAQQKFNGHFPPQILAGHSFGTYNALVAAGAVTFEEGLWLVNRRAIATHHASQVSEKPGGMLAVLASEDNDILKEALRLYSLSLCLVNDKSKTVIGGLRDSLENAKGYLRNHNIRWLPLDKISGAFHTDFMAPAAKEFKAVIKKVKIKDAEIPIMANTTAQPIQTKEQIEKELLDQLTQSVRWMEIIIRLGELGIDRSMEFGAAGNSDFLSKINVSLLGGTIISRPGRDNRLPVATVWER